MITVNRNVTLKQAKRGRRRIATGVPRPPASPRSNAAPANPNLGLPVGTSGPFSDLRR